jgi:hypothetical protein
MNCGEDYVAFIRCLLTHYVYRRRRAAPYLGIEKRIANRSRIVSGGIVDDARQDRQRTKPMPLSSTGESGNCELYNDNVYFFMTSGGHRIRCGVTDLALEVLEPKLDRTTGKGRLAAFGAHRAFVERMASAKFDKKIWERDGITIIVREIDINAHAAATG